MNRQFYVNYIEEKLIILGRRIETRGKNNLLDLHIHAETFFAGLFNIVFDYKLENINAINQNSEGIDLIDRENRIVVQVSSACTKEKIIKSLSKEILKQYSNYKYKFISISKDVPKSLRGHEFHNPYNLCFDSSQDIWDISRLIRKISSMEVSEQEAIYNFIKGELGQDVEGIRLESNLAKIINVLAEVDLDLNTVPPELIPYSIEEKIKFNHLEKVKEIIDEYKIYYQKLDDIYSEFDRSGKNKSFSILQNFKTQYIIFKNAGLSPVEIFWELIADAINHIKDSRNYEDIPIEELELCVRIVVVDAFIRCKIFENPEGYKYVTTR